jgi:hypothetical protein
MMEDLTKKFIAAIALRENNSFNKQKWMASLLRIVDQGHIDFLWNDEEDKWVKLGDEKKLLVMAAREVPLLFIADINIVSEISNNYEDDFIFISTDDPNIRQYSLNTAEIHRFFPWNTNVIESKCFSLNELFYATH